MSVALHPDFLKLPDSQRYLLAISGGRDSVALLHLLLDSGLKNLVLLHVNHALRGGESDADAALVRQLAEEFDLPCEIEKVDVAVRMEETGESMELAARNVRHRFFAACARKRDCPRILLAHHADDQAETVLFNLLRGSGGLKGMQFFSEHEINGQAVEFFRPMLEVSRVDINDYLTDHQIFYHDDKSNTEAVATRNRIRNEAIPLLENVMGREIRPALVRAAAISDSRDKALQEILAGYQLEDPQGRLFLPEIQKLTPALQRMAVHGYLKQCAVAEISHHLLERCLTLLDTESPAKINLPGGRHFRRKEKRLFVV